MFSRRGNFQGTLGGVLAADVGEIRHKDTDGGQWRGGLLPGLDPARADYGSFADFCDPDGNAWVLQERGHR